MPAVSIQVHLYMAGTAKLNLAVGWWAFIYCKRLVIIYINMALILELMSLEY